MKNITIAVERTAATVIDFCLMVGLILTVIALSGNSYESVLAIAWRSNILGFGSLALIEALLVASWGKTPGMALLGLSVRNQDSTKLSFPKSLLRSLLIFALGSFIGLPMYGLIYIAWGINLEKLLLTGTAFWDDLLHTAVIKKQRQKVQEATL